VAAAAIKAESVNKVFLIFVSSVREMQSLLLCTEDTNARQAELSEFTPSLGRMSLNFRHGTPSRV
jgi:hypothetical protein